MSSIRDKISQLKGRKKRLEERQRQIHMDRLNLDTKQFYEDSLKVHNASNELTIVITPGHEYRELADRNFTQQKAVKHIFHALQKDVNPDLYGDDFADEIAKEQNSIIIQLKSIAVKPTIVSLPDSCTEFQVQKLSEFNQAVKDFRQDHNGSLYVPLTYPGVGSVPARDLDSLMNTIKVKENQNQK